MKRYISQLFAKSLNVILITAVEGGLIWHIYSDIVSRSNNPMNTLFLLLAVYIGVYIYCIRIYSGFLIMISKIPNLIYSQTLSVLIADAALYLLLMILNGLLLNPVPMLCAFCVQFGIICIWSIIAHKWYFRNFSGLRTLFIYGNENCYESFMQEFGFRKKFQIQEAISIDSYREHQNHAELLNGVQTVLISDIPLDDRDELWIQKRGF